MQSPHPLGILERLVGFESVSHRSNLDIADYIADLASSCGARIEKFRSPDGNKEALLLGFGPQVNGGVVLSGHMDVVPVTDQTWTSNPFQLRQADDKLFGRGAVDMKGFLALALSCAMRLDQAALSRPLYLAFSYDEEVTCEGVKPIVAHLKEHVAPPTCVIVGEPTEMRIVGAHKGAVDWHVQFQGKAAHSSLPHLGSNAIHAAAQVVHLIDQIADEFAASPAAGSELFDVPYTTVSVGLINGGSAPNVIPAHCELHLEARPLHKADELHLMDQLNRLLQRSVLPRLKRGFPDADVIITEVDSLPPLALDPLSPALQLVKDLTGLQAVEAVSYATEAGFFQSAGMPTVVFGPGSIHQAHQPDEFITISQFAAGEGFLEQLSQKLY